MVRATRQYWQAWRRRLTFTYKLELINGPAHKVLGDYLREGLKENSKIKIHSSTHPTMCAGMTTYALDGMTGPDLQKTLWEKGKLQPRSVGQELLRHCVHIYNNEDELDQALSIMNSL